MCYTEPVWDRPALHATGAVARTLLMDSMSVSFTGFFPYGVHANHDTRVPAHDDFAYELLPLEVPIVLFETNLYVSHV